MTTRLAPQLNAAEAARYAAVRDAKAAAARRDCDRKPSSRELSQALRGMPRPPEEPDDEAAALRLRQQVSAQLAAVGEGWLPDCAFRSLRSSQREGGPFVDDVLDAMFAEGLLERTERDEFVSPANHRRGYVTRRYWRLIEP